MADILLENHQPVLQILVDRSRSLADFTPVELHCNVSKRLEPFGLNVAIGQNYARTTLGPTRSDDLQFFS